MSICSTSSAHHLIHLPAILVHNIRLLPKKTQMNRRTPRLHPFARLPLDPPQARCCLSAAHLLCLPCSSDTPAYPRLLPTQHGRGTGGAAAPTHRQVQGRGRPRRRQRRCWPRGQGWGALGVLARGEPPPTAVAHHLARRARWLFLLPCSPASPPRPARTRHRRCSRARSPPSPRTSRTPTTVGRGLLSSSAHGGDSVLRCWRWAARTTSRQPVACHGSARRVR